MVIYASSKIQNKTLEVNLIELVLERYQAVSLFMRFETYKYGQIDKNIYFVV